MRLEDKDSLWAPGATPPTPTQWAQVWDGNSSNKSGHPRSLGGAHGEGAGERAEEALPASHWAAVYTRAMSWLLALPPAPRARCARSRRAPAWLLPAVSALPLLGLGSSRHG